jgi:hypothetical protein
MPERLAGQCAAILLKRCEKAALYCSPIKSWVPSMASRVSSSRSFSRDSMAGRASAFGYLSCSSP